MKYRHGLVGKGDGDYATFLTVSQVIATRRRREQAGWCPGEHSHPLIALLKMRHFCSLSDESQAVPIPSRRSRRRGRVHRAARLVPRRIPTGRRRASPTACGCHRTRSSPPPHHRNPWRPRARTDRPPQGIHPTRRVFRARRREQQRGPVSRQHTHLRATLVVCVHLPLRNVEHRARGLPGAATLEAQQSRVFTFKPNPPLAPGSR